ncbi:TIR-like protein FxsC [Streptomyces sp. R21]|uniref:TIR-like protein FxsC n=1 Tax=Streptomyces sp. R21 TaxID=3238627 RepID=A0AB39PJP3_9ACTN
MPEGTSPTSEPLARAVAALSAAAPELDGTALADVLWLASRMAEGADRGSAVPAPDQPTGAVRLEPPPAWQWEAAPPEEAVPPTERAADAPGRDVHERLSGAPERIRGDAVAAPWGSGLPLRRAVTGALRPWKRPWPQGRRSVLDVEATVEAYARSGELIPAFRPAPERWFDLVLVVDRSPAMGVWRETITDFTAALGWLGAFRTLQVRELTFRDGLPELRDGLRQLVAPGQLSMSDARRLVVVVSDCAASGWREPDVWRHLRTWSLSTPVALLNPLPQKLWRRTGLDLPTVRVSARLPGSAGPLLDVDTSPVPADRNSVEKGGDWLPVPVLSMDPQVVDRWSRALMRTAPEGCGAVLVPREGRTGRPRPRSAAAAAEGFLHTASRPAARLAVLCSAFDRLSMRLVHLVREQLVPEAMTAELAELLISGLFRLHTAEDGTVELSLPQDVQLRLRKELAEHEVWRLYRVLSDYLSSQVGGGRDLLAVVRGEQGRELPAELRPFAEASQRTLELLGLLEGGLVDDSEGHEPEEEQFVGAANPPAAQYADADAEGEFEQATPVAEPEYLPRLAPAAGAAADNRPYFFLSYAHTPAWGSGGGDPDHWVHRLFTDLCDHIMALTDLPAGAPAGFMDREMHSGEGWSEKLSENLATCRVFVPLFSPRYFTSERCGREWFAFHERMVRARAAGAGSVAAIVPALWTHMEYTQFPDSVRHIHMDTTAFGDRYATNGIYGLIKLNRLRDEYEETVLGLAQRIVRVAHESPLPSAQPRSYVSTPTAFKPRGEGPRHIHLTVAAPTRDSIPEHRDGRPYGEDALDWNPYRSESTRPLPAFAEELIRSLDYRITVSSFDDDAGEDMLGEGTGNAAPSRPGILLVDRWALTDDERRRRLRAFDTAARPWITAIVPWDRADPQGHGEEGRKLTNELERTLPLILDRGRRTDCRIAVNGVPTLKAFTDILPAVVAHATQQYLKNAEAHPPRGRHYPRPRLVGPTHPPPYGDPEA